MNLREAIQTINSTQRSALDPPIVTLQHCDNCGSEFAALPADVSYLKTRLDLRPKCRICARKERNRKESERLKNKRKQTKLEAETQ
jgi:hypothetical protein